MPDAEPDRPLRLAAAGDDRSAWITLLTTEHYNLQTQRASTISETNGRASIFLGSVSSGLVALGFSGQGGRTSPGFVAFGVVVLTALVFLGVATFARTVQASIDDAAFARRIEALRDLYAQLVPDLAPLLAVARGGDLYQRRLERRGQRLLTVSGSIAVLTAMLVGGDVGLLLVAVTGALAVAVVVGAVAGLLVAGALVHHQSTQWREAFAS